MGRPTVSPGVKPANVMVNVKFVGRIKLGLNGVPPAAGYSKSDKSKIANSEFEMLLPLYVIGFGNTTDPLS